MSESTLRIVWIYPDLLSTYGDRGNLLILARRAQLRGIPVETYEIRSDQQMPWGADIYLIGGGEDGPQALAAQRLMLPDDVKRVVAEARSATAQALQCGTPGQGSGSRSLQTPGRTRSPRPAGWSMSLSICSAAGRMSISAASIPSARIRAHALDFVPSEVANPGMV